MKRAIDILIVIIAGPLLLPVAIVVGGLVFLTLGKPVMFRQPRPGEHGRIFIMPKFRTMLNAVDDRGIPLPDSKRLTIFGNLLRTTSLDELPGLWCVLKGDMSLVGPRPLLVEYLPLYSERQARRHEVKPGITGWAQVNGRNALSWEEKFELDVWYVDNQSFWLDIKILFLTVLKVFKREGVSAEGEVTMPKFTGRVHE